MIFLNEDILKPRGYIKDSDYVYHKQINPNVNFYIKHLFEWDNDLGFNVEFYSNEDPLLMAYCLNEDDFIQVLNTFNV